MANQQHVEWFCEGAQAWNDKRDKGRIDLSGANLARDVQNQTQHAPSVTQGVSLEGIGLTNANLRDADLSDLQLVKADMFEAQGQNAVFRRANLDGAELDAGDFSGAMFNGARLQNASLDTGTFTDAKFDGAKLQDAFCGGSDFTGATFARAILQRTNFDRANLKNTNLTMADLTGARLSQADLCGARLLSTQMKNADLRNANLSGIVAPDTQLWTAILYRNECEPLNGPTDMCASIDSVAQLLEVCRQLTEYNHTATKDMGATQTRTLYLRGHEVSNWELTPSVIRCPKKGEIDVRGKEGEMLTDLMSRRPEEFIQMNSALSQWVLAQHHRLKTRLLDITRNPLVALFFACDGERYQAEDGALHVFAVPTQLVKPFSSDSITVVANFAKLPPAEQDVLLGRYLDGGNAEEKFVTYSTALVRLYHHIGSEKPNFKERIDPRDFYRVFIAQPERSVERLRAQSGAFLVSAFHNRFEPKEIRRVNPGVPLYEHYKFTVPSGSKKSIIRELALLNLTRETLFPGLDEATQAVMRDHGTETNLE